MWEGGAVASQSRTLRFLIDTNIFIAAEPRDDEDVESGAEAVAEMLRRISEAGHAIEVHPAGLVDIDRGRDESRRHARRIQHAKYATLPSPPTIPDAWQSTAAWADGDNDHVDLQHLAALEAHAASFLVTEDRKLHRRAAALGLDDRVVTISAGLALLRTLHDQPALLPPTVERVLAHTLPPNDPIFASLRQAYHPDFDAWFARVREQRRTAFVIRGSDGLLAAVALVKVETDGNDARLDGRVMKISTLKVAEDAVGSRRGELLKALFTEAAKLGVDGIYLTVFADDHPALVATISQFGFVELPHVTTLNEQVFGKRLATPVGVARGVPDDALRYHVELGPPALHPTRGELHIVPITPAYSARLFPDASHEPQLFEPAPYGNALRKAYLSRSPTRQIQSGDVLAFYESASGRGGTSRGLFAVGLVERPMVSSEPGVIAEAVGTRTVYSMPEIQDMAQGGEILALIFRQDRVLDPEILLAELIANGALTAHPQSITKVRGEGAAWLRRRLQQ
jgi:hypothetical protein